MASQFGRESIGRSAWDMIPDRKRVATAPTRRELARRWLPVICAAIAVGVLLYGAWAIARLDRNAVLGYFGLDRRIYMVATERWLAGASFYEPYQLAGPYQIDRIEILYPPILLLVLVPFTVLPASLWWAIPIGLTAWAILRLRPGPIAWPVLALCAIWPPTVTKILTGNPDMWALAALSLGVLYAGPAVFVLLKPSLVPFALWGVRHRRWWVGLAVFVTLSVPFGALWIAWAIALLNSRGGGLLYSANEVPLLLIPVIAWFARSDSIRSPAERDRPSQRTSGTQSKGSAPRL
jgi:hypothetical protein